MWRAACTHRADMENPSMENIWMLRFRVHWRPCDWDLLDCGDIC